MWNLLVKPEQSLRQELMLSKVTFGIGLTITLLYTVAIITPFVVDLIMLLLTPILTHLTIPLPVLYTTTPPRVENHPSSHRIVHQYYPMKTRY